MKLKLKENMYVRNCYGRIAKIEYIEDNTAYCDNWLYQSYEDHITFINLDDEEDIDEILKASYNIIDILEVGDYVNGYKIKYIDDCKGAMREFYYDYENPNEDAGHWQEEIKSVITHEQMEQMAYKVVE